MWLPFSPEFFLTFGEIFTFLFKITYISFGESGNEFPDNFEFATEECVLVLFMFIFVHAKEIKVDSRNGFDETLERSGELELPEEAS